MDFSLTEDQDSLRALAADIFGDKATTERIEAVEATAERFDRDLWRELAGAGLLGIALPEASGGAGLGLVELALVCEEHGRVVAPIPLVWTTTAAAAIAVHGDASQQSWVQGAVSGDVVLTCALPVAAAGSKVVDGAISGEIAGVPYAHVAAAIVIPSGGELYLLEPSAPGVTILTGISTTNEIHGELLLDQAPVTRIGSQAADWWEARLLIALAATSAGLCDAALKRTAAYTSERLQFEKPLSTFQGVQLKAADAYVDAGGIHAAVLQAAWRLDDAATPKEASAYVLTAAWWAAEAGQHCVHITQHLHGGMGADITYPIHRYFLWGKSIELYVGGASRLLARLGDVIVTLDNPGDDITIPGYETVTATVA
jgi:alkylation response protein AidB-like acyl-CoA dehydrogenase